MPLDQKLLEILVCPQCKGLVVQTDGGTSLLCNNCNLKYPVRDGIPIMLVDEAADIRGSKKGDLTKGSSVKLPRISFRVISGPDQNMSFQLEHGTCRAIGRSAGDTGRTQVFNVDLALAIDESTKSVILKYITRQFKMAEGHTSSFSDGFGQFRRAPDVILSDGALSKLHAMIFAYESQVGVLDLVSKNGTFVNGAEIESRMLTKGDKIEVGETTILFEG